MMRVLRSLNEGIKAFFASFISPGKKFGEKETKNYRKFPDSFPDSSWKKNW
jgi:hypothetical protein